jgi:hypothetical protein
MAGGNALNRLRKTGKRPLMFALLATALAAGAVYVNVASAQGNQGDQGNQGNSNRSGNNQGNGNGQGYGGGGYGGGGNGMGRASGLPDFSLQVPNAIIRSSNLQ